MEVVAGKNCVKLHNTDMLQVYTEFEIIQTNCWQKKWQEEVSLWNFFASGLLNMMWSDTVEFKKGNYFQ